jgi:DNA-directed RNA polymerase subunit E'/Rpb7
MLMPELILKILSKDKYIIFTKKCLQVVVGEIVSSEDYGMKINFGSDDGFHGFLKTDQIP